MNESEYNMIEMELKKFTSRNFERPSKCKNPEQIQFYVRELCHKIQEVESRFNYVPTWIYSLLAQYNAQHNLLTHPEHGNNDR